MKLSRFMLGFWLFWAASPVDAIHLARKPGETYELTLTRDSVEQSNDGTSKGSSHDQDSIIERVEAVSSEGVQLEYDLPASASADERNSQWQFPVRVFKSADGQLRLLNASELEQRVSRWLKSADWTRAVCGHWIFTWNAFKIECDPQSVLRTVEAFDMTSVDLRDGTPYRGDSALEPTKLTLKPNKKGDFSSVALQVDANAIRRERAENDVAVGEVTNKPVTLESALQKHATDEVTGTISVTFATDQTGNPVRRTKVTKLFSKEAGGTPKMQTITEILERTRLRTR